MRVMIMNGDENGVDPAFDTTDHVWKSSLAARSFLEDSRSRG